jgi:hypothetical protein
MRAMGHAIAWCSGIVMLTLTSGCAFDISHVTRVPTTFASADGSGWTLMGFFVGYVYPELVDDAEAEADIASCHLVGS